MSAGIRKWWMSRMVWKIEVEVGEREGVCAFLGSLGWEGKVMRRCVRMRRGIRRWWMSRVVVVVG